MSQPEKLPGIVSYRLGKHQRQILQIALTNEPSTGAPTPLWAHIYNEFKLFYTSLPKTQQPNFMNQERKLRRSVQRLVKKDFLHPVSVFAFECLFEETKQKSYVFYVLTQNGRNAAKLILRKQKLSKTANRNLSQAINFFKSQGCSWVTLNQVESVLWNLTKKDFSRGEFDSFWTKRRISIKLKNFISKTMRLHKNNRKIIYCLE